MKFSVEGIKELKEKIFKILVHELHPLNRALTLEPSYYLFLILNEEQNTMKKIGLDFQKFIRYMRRKFGRGVLKFQDFIPEADDGQIKYCYKGQNYKILYGVNAGDIYDWLQQFEIVYSELENTFVQALNISPMKFFLLALSLQDRVLDFLLQNEEYLKNLPKEAGFPRWWYLPSDENWPENIRNAIIFNEVDVKSILDELEFSKEEQDLFFNCFVASVNRKENFSISPETFVEQQDSSGVNNYWFIKLDDSYYLRPKSISMGLINNFAKIFKGNFLTTEILNRVKKRLVFELADRIFRNVNFVQVIVGVKIEDQNGTSYEADLLLVVDELYFLPIAIADPPKNGQIDLTREVDKFSLNSDLINPIITGFDLEDREFRKFEPESNLLIPKDNVFPILVTPVLDFGKYQIISGKRATGISFVSLEEFLGLIEEIDNGISLVKFLKQYKSLREITEIYPYSSFGDVFSAFKLKKCLSFGGAPLKALVLLNLWGGYRHDSLCQKWANLIKFKNEERPFVWKFEPLEGNLFLAFIPNSKVQAKVLAVKNEFFLWFLRNAEFLSGKDLQINEFLIDVLSYYLSKIEDFLYANLNQSKYFHFYFFSIESLNKHKGELEALVKLAQKEDLDNPYVFIVNKMPMSVSVAVIFDEEKISQIFDRNRLDNGNEIELVRELINKIGLTLPKDIFSEFFGKPRHIFSFFDLTVPVKERLPEPILLSEEDRCLAESLTFKACYEYKFKPGRYIGDKAKDVINKVVTYLEKFLADEINKFNKEKLLCRLLLEIERVEFKYCYSENKIKTGAEAYLEYDPVGLWVEERNYEQKSYRTLSYLVEFLLKNSEGNSQRHVTDIDFLEIIALGEQLLELYFISDNIHYGIWEKYGLEITERYEIKQTQEQPLAYKKLVDKQHSNKLFGKNFSLVSQEEDEIYWKKLDEAFKRDLGFTFMNFMGALAEICDGPWDEENLDVVQIFKSKEELAKKIKELSYYYPTLDVDTIDSVLDFLILRKENINDYNPAKMSNNEHRFRIKPLIEMDDKKIIFGRFLAYKTSIIWRYRIYEGFFPYSIEGNKCYSEINSVINDRKRFLDDRLEDFVFNSIREVNNWDICEKDFDLHSFFGKEFPESLGDFDVFCASAKSKEIWLIETKNIRPSFVPSEIRREFRNLFYDLEKNKRVDYATKFVKRITFVRQNLQKILGKLGVKDNEEFWNIKSFFVMRNPSFNLFNIPEEFREIEFVDLQDFLELLDGWKESHCKQRI